MRHVTRREFVGYGVAGMAAGLTSRARGAAMQRWGFIGTGGRGTYLMGQALAIPEVDVPAACDINQQHLDGALAVVEKARGHVPEGYSGSPKAYRELLKRDDIDAVVIATPVPLHAKMAADAMRAGKHVLSEVGGAYTLDDCWDIVDAEAESGRTYMLAENVCYYRQNLMVLDMVARGLFGDLTYAECGYVHDCRALYFDPAGNLTWRGELCRDARSNWYPTHAIGPVAQWLGINRGDRFESLVAVQSDERALSKYVHEHFGADHALAKTKFALGDSTTVLLRTARGAVVDLRFDVCSARPVVMTTYFQLQGTRAAYEDRLGERIWIEGRSPENTWEDLAKYQDEFKPALWARWGEEAAATGHGGADFFVIREFFEALRDGRPAPIDACDSAAWSCITPLSADSIERGGEPVDVPDFTRGAWKRRSAPH